MVRGHGLQRRVFLPATRYLVGTARRERAVGGFFQQVGRQALDGNQTFLAGGVDLGQRFQQTHRIRMGCLLVQVSDGRQLDDEPGVHDDDLVHHAGDDAQVMGDPDDGHAELLFQAQHQVNDLGLDGDVESGGGFVGDEQGGVARQGHGNADALPLAAGELVGIVLQAIDRVGDADQRQQLGRAGVGLLLPHAQVHHQRFGQLHPHGQHRVERRHRVLEDHGHLPAANPPQLFRRKLHEVTFVEDDLAVFDLSRGAGDEAHDRLHGDRFAGSAFADDGHRLALAQIE